MPPAPAPSRPAGPPGAAQPAARPVRAGIGPAAFRTGEGPEERLIGQVAFALAAEAGAAPQNAEALQALRDQATASLSDFAFRYLHNRAEEIRREAVAEAAARMGRPSRFPMLVLANLTALAIAAAAGLALAANPHLLAGLLGPGFLGPGFLGQ